MANEQAIAARFVQSLKANPALHNVKLKNLWNPDGSAKPEIHIATRGGFVPSLPATFEGIPVVLIPWPKDRG